MNAFTDLVSVNDWHAIVMDSTPMPRLERKSSTFRISSALSKRGCWLEKPSSWRMTRKP